MSSIVPTVPWNSLMRDIKWKQGEHVMLIGPNGSGKTVINKHLLRYRIRRHGYICVFVTKPEDEELFALKDSTKFIIVKDNNRWTSSSYPRLILWPKAGDFSDQGNQKRVFRKALQGMWQATRWTACLNELPYLYDHLHLQMELKTLYQQARSAKFSLTGESQRPRNVPLAAFTNCTHDFFAACRDDEDLKRISGIGNAHSKTIRLVVQDLQQFEFCYVNAITGDIVRTKATPFNLAKSA